MRALLDRVFLRTGELNRIVYRTANMFKVQKVIKLNATPERLNNGCADE
jgi:hypothetical protein